MRDINVARAAAALVASNALGGLGWACGWYKVEAREGEGEPAGTMARVVQAAGALSQTRLAALYVCMTHGQGAPIDADDMTRVLAASFPGSNVGDRHAPYYVSKARTGQLEGVPEGFQMAPIPHIKRAPKGRGVEARLQRQRQGTVADQARAAAAGKAPEPAPEPPRPREPIVEGPGVTPDSDPAAWDHARLVAWLSERGLDHSGRTGQLIRRVKEEQARGQAPAAPDPDPTAETEEAPAPVAPAAADLAAEFSEPDFAAMQRMELIEWLKSRKVNAAGKTEALRERAREAYRAGVGLA